MLLGPGVLTGFVRSQLVSWKMKVSYDGSDQKSIVSLVGGFKDFLFSIMYGMSSFPLTFIFFKMVKTTSQ